MFIHFHPFIEPALSLFKNLKIKYNLHLIKENELEQYRRKEVIRLKNEDYDSLLKFNRYFYKKRFINQKLVLSFIDKFISKIVDEIDNPTWRKDRIKNITYYKVDIGNELYQYRYDWFTMFIDAYIEYLHSDNTIQVIERRISQYKTTKKKKIFKGPIGEAARAVKESYQRNPQNYASLTAAAKEFYDENEFYGRKNYKFSTFLASVKKA